MYIYILPAILSSAQISTPKVDLTITIGIIITLSSIISSIFVAIINNIFQLRLKKQDLHYQEEFNKLQLAIKKAEIENQERSKSLEYQNQISFKELENKYSLKKYQWETYYKSATEIFSSMLTEVGLYLAYTDNLTQYEKSIASIYQAFAFADDELSYLLFELIGNLHKFANDDTNKYHSGATIHAMEDCAKYINKILTKYIQD